MAYGLRDAREPVDLGGQDEVALGEPVDLVGPDLDLYPAPSKVNVGMMPLLFGKLTHRGSEIERLAEICEGECALQAMVVRNFPGRKLALNGAISSGVN